MIAAPRSSTAISAEAWALIVLLSIPCWRRICRP
jgi:hypothetical protein